MIATKIYKYEDAGKKFENEFKCYESELMNKLK